MAELFTIDEIEQHLREEVARAGGSKKWSRKHKVYLNHALHMLDNGSAASLENVLHALGMERVVLYRSKQSVK